MGGACGNVDGGTEGTRSASPLLAQRTSTVPGTPAASRKPAGVRGPLAVVAGAISAPGLYGTMVTRETFLGRLPHPGHCPKSRLKNFPRLSIKKAYLFVHIRALPQPCCGSPLPHFWELVYLSGAPISATVTQGQMEFTNLVPQDWIYLFYICIL